MASGDADHRALQTLGPHLRHAFLASASASVDNLPAAARQHRQYRGARH